MTAAADGLVETAARTIADLLGTSVAAVHGPASLFDLPGFDSVCIVATLERLEDELGVEVPADRILPEAFDSLESLSALVRSADPMGGAR